VGHAGGVGAVGSGASGVEGPPRVTSSSPGTVVPPPYESAIDHLPSWLRILRGDHENALVMSGIAQ